MYKLTFLAARTVSAVDDAILTLDLALLRTKNRLKLAALAQFDKAKEQRLDKAAAVVTAADDAIEAAFATRDLAVEQLLEVSDTLDVERATLTTKVRNL